jgi:hypothetical protein
MKAIPTVNSPIQPKVTYEMVIYEKISESWVWYSCFHTIKFRDHELYIYHHYEDADTENANVLEHSCVAYVPKTAATQKENTFVGKNKSIYLLEAV